MAGAKYRIVKLNGPTKYYNVLFQEQDLKTLKGIATRNNVTAAELVRIAVKEFIERDKDEKYSMLANQGHSNR